MKFVSLRKFVIYNTIVVFSTIVLFSCENDIATINSLTSKEKTPDESAKDITIIYSDSGMVEFVLTSPVLDKYYSNESYIEFPKGIKIITYGDSNTVKNTLTANYAINFESRKMMEAKSKVVIKNLQTDEIIETEHIVWDQLNHKIFSDVFIKRTNSEGIMYGDGFDADEKFTKYNIRNPRFTLYLNEK